MAVQGSTTGAIWGRSTSTAMITEALTSSAGNVYQITSTAHRILDPTTSMTVNCTAGTSVDTSWLDGGYDYFLGKVKLKARDSDATFTGAWLTLSSLGNIISWSINPVKNAVEVTSIGDEWKKYWPVETSHTVTINRYYVDSNFWDWVNAGKQIILQIYEDAASGFWVKGYVTSFGPTMAVGTVDTEAITVQTSGPIEYF